MANLDRSIPNLKLNDGTSMPMLGYGTGTAWYKQGEESKIDQAIIDAVKIAIDMGYTHLDGAESMFPASVWSRKARLTTLSVQNRVRARNCHQRVRQRPLEAVHHNKSRQGQHARHRKRTQDEPEEAATRLRRSVSSSCTYSSIF